MAERERSSDVLDRKRAREELARSARANGVTLTPISGQKWEWPPGVVVELACTKMDTNANTKEPGDRTNKMIHFAPADTPQAQAQAQESARKRPVAHSHNSPGSQGQS